MGADVMQQGETSLWKGDKNTMGICDRERPKIVQIFLELVGSESWVRGVGSEDRDPLDRTVL